MIYWAVRNLVALSIFMMLSMCQSIYGQIPLSPSAPVPRLQVDGNRYTQNLVYRPSNVDYQIVEGERFDIIYQEGTSSMARRTKSALLSSWAETDSLVGPVNDGFNTPVIINGYNDRANGFVQAFPFSQEIEATAIKADELVARSSTWPALVVPHELVHSAHLAVQPNLGLSQLIRPFSDDAARSINGLFPTGIGEGAAVYRESQLDGRGGRLNEPLFTMKMKAAMLSEDPWGFNEMIEPPSYTRPFNRHYIGGSHAFKYLTERSDEIDYGFFHTAVSWQNRFPFLGMGAWLSVGAGQWPHQLTDEMQNRMRAKYQKKYQKRRPFTETSQLASAKGLEHRRPYWINDTTLVAYVNGYNIRAGFYKIDVPSGRRTPLRIQTITEDYRYSLSRDTTYLYASRYIQDPIATSQQIAEVEQIHIQTGKKRQLTEHGRSFAPAEGVDGNIQVVINNGSFTRWGVIEEDSIRTLTPSEPSTIRRIAARPHSDNTYAVLKNVDGRQLIYKAQSVEGDSVQLEPWLEFNDAIIYDLSWGPEGRYMLFSADYPEVVNIFAFDTRKQQVLQLARVPFGAREPALSPDLSTLAFVSYQHERYNLVTLPFNPDSATRVPNSEYKLNGSAPTLPDPPGVTISDEQTEDYSALKHLKPRALYPRLYGNITNWDRYFGSNAEPLAPGIEITGSDPLREWGYRSNIYWQDGRIWGEARLETSRWKFRPSLSVYNRSVIPSTDTLAGLEERGLGLGIKYPYIFESNVYQSFMQFEMETQLKQTRRYDGGLSGLSPYNSRLAFISRMAFAYRLQQNSRDIIPNNGLVWANEGRYDTALDQIAGRISVRRGIRSTLDLYLPFLRKSNTGIRIGVGVLAQNSSTFNGSTFLPRGYNTLSVDPAGTFVRMGGEIVQPVWFIDSGFTLLPLYFKALSLYGFGQTFGKMNGLTVNRSRSSVGAGIDLQLRVFYRFNFRLRFGLAYRPERGDVRPVFH